MTFKTPEEARHWMRNERSPVPEKLRIWSYHRADRFSSFNYVRSELFQGLAREEEFSEPAHLVFGPLLWIEQEDSLSKLVDENTVIFTLPETTRVRSLELLNKAKAVIVPSQWGLNCLSAQGVTSQLYLCPLGVDSSLFTRPQHSPQDRLRFGCVADHFVGGTRKSLEELLIAFAALVFQDAELEILCPPHSYRPEITDSRVKYIDEYLLREDYHKWIESLDAGICVSKGEGFGLPMIEFAAAGKPVIFSNYGTMSEFLPVTSDFKVQGKIVPAIEEYAGLGHWFQPNVQSITSRLDWACRLTSLLPSFGFMFREHVRPLTWEKARERLTEILRQERLVM